MVVAVVVGLFFVPRGGVGGRRLSFGVLFVCIGSVASVTARAGTTGAAVAEVLKRLARPCGPFSGDWCPAVAVAVERLLSAPASLWK